jgi:hypothetical protein
MLKSLLKICAAGIAALSSACEEGPASIEVAPRSQAIGSTFSHVASAGPLLLEVIGQPFAMDRNDFLNILAKTLEDAVSHNPPLRYTFDQRETPNPNYRTVVLFNPPRNLDPHELCGGGGRPVESGDDKLTVMAVFCNRQTVMAAVQGWVKKAKSVDDPRFRQLIGQVGRSLYAPAPDPR